MSMRISRHKIRSKQHLRRVRETRRDGLKSNIHNLRELPSSLSIMSHRCPKLHIQKFRVDRYIRHHGHRGFPMIGIMSNLILILVRRLSFLGRNLEVEVRASVFSVIVRSVSMNLTLKILRVSSINSLRRLKYGHTPKGNQNSQQ